MRKVAVLVAVAMSFVGTLVAAKPAFANCQTTNHFCAWKDINYGTPKLFDNTYPADTNNLFPSEKDAVSSGKNFTSHVWCGVNEHKFQPDSTVFAWGPGDQISSLVTYNANDLIDHFDVRDNVVDCVGDYPG